MGTKTSLVPELGARGISLCLVPSPPLPQKEQCAGAAPAPGEATDRDSPLLILSLMLLKVGSTIFLPSGGKGKAWAY